MSETVHQLETLCRRPYPGLDPFGFAERDLFFGRDAESRVVSATIATEPVSILTGASGTGKSSLIRAAVIPNLMSRGWATVYAHPGADAVTELKDELLAQAILDIDLECDFVDRLIAVSACPPGQAGTALSTDSRLSEAVQWFARLDHRDSRRGVIGIGAHDKVPHLAWMAGAVAGCVSSERLVQALREMSGVYSLTADPCLRELSEVRDACALERTRLIKALNGDGPPLGTLARRVWREWLQPLGFSGLVMLLDQAEEIYTGAQASRMGAGLQPERNGVNAPRPSQESRLFEPALLEDLFAELTSEPVRLCFGLRPEWYTQLRVSLGAYMPDESAAVHILTAMTREQAERAIVAPAERTGVQVANDALAAMLIALDVATAGKGMDPFLLGLVTNQAWLHAAHTTPDSAHVRIAMSDLHVIAAGPVSEDAASKAATRSTLESEIHAALVKGALEWLVHTSLETLQESDRFDALDILDSLFTTGGTRRIVPQRDLVSRPLRSENDLGKLLGQMEQARLVRFIRQGDETFVEIRHDRLLEPMLWFRDKLVAAERSDKAGRPHYRSMLGKAIEMLLTMDGKRVSQVLADRLKSNTLPSWARESLRYNASAIVWDAPSARATLCSFLHEGMANEDLFSDPDRDGSSRREHYRQLLKVLMCESTSLRGELPEPAATTDGLKESLLRGLQVELLLDQPPPLERIEVLGVDARMLLLDSLLRDSGAERRISKESIRRWTQACLGLTSTPSRS